MFLIQCPDGHSFPVPTKAAGSVATCPTCGATQNVPKLGELRKLPRADESGSDRSRKSSGTGGNIAFSIFMLLAIGTGLTSAFAAFRWQNTPVPFTQDQHIAEEAEILGSYSPVQLVSAWEQLETIGVGEQEPEYYMFLQNLRDHWRSVCLISLGLTVASVLIAFSIIGFARTPKGGADT